MTVTAPPRSVEQEELQALIEGARRRARRRRRRYGVALVLVGLCGAGFYALLARDGGGAGSPARGARVAGVGPHAFRFGEFWYVRTVRAMHESLPAGGVAWFVLEAVETIDLAEFYGVCRADGTVARRMTQRAMLEVTPSGVRRDPGHVTLPGDCRPARPFGRHARYRRRPC